MGRKWVWVLILVLALIAAIAVMSWRNQSDTVAEPTNIVPTESAKKTVVWTAGGTAIPGQFADADTVKLAENSYRMYYAVEPEVAGNKLQVYSATSNDGKTWTSEPGERKISATFPDVVKLVDGTFRMYFQNSSVIKSAVSPDGLTWTDEAGVRIDTTNNLNLTFENVAAPSVLRQDDGTFVMVYRGTINEPYTAEKVPNSNTQILLWAISTDGLEWTKRGIAVDSRKTHYGLADGPELFVWRDNSVKLSFWSYQGVYWSDFNTVGFTEPEKVFSLKEVTELGKFPTPTAGDPTYAEFGGVWYMYYGEHPNINYATASD